MKLLNILANISVKYFISDSFYFRMVRFVQSVEASVQCSIYCLPLHGKVVTVLN